jgi:hypothetical protein
VVIACGPSAGELAKDLAPDLPRGWSFAADADQTLGNQVGVSG